MIRSPAMLAAALTTIVVGACSSKATDATRAPPSKAAPEAPATPSVPGAPASAGATLCGHGVPADTCTQCNPDLVAVFQELGDWCEEHGLPESHCRQCNPALRFDDVSAATGGEAWCKEHAAPEAKCTKCNPKLIPKFIEDGDFCREHGYPESVCPYCHPAKVKAAGHALPAFPEPGTKVKLASAETEAEAGIQTASAEAKPFARSLQVVGQIQFDQNRLARLSSRGEAIVSQVKVDVGDIVKKGAPLVVLSSGSVGGAQSRAVASKARLEAAESALAREQGLLSIGISSKREVEQARTELAGARAELETARAELRAVGAGEGGSGGRYALAAPFDGTIVARDAVAGRAVSGDDVIVEVADLTTVWVVLDVPEEEAGKVRVGQRVIVQPEGGDHEHDGRVNRVAASVDPHTRTVRVRVDLSNREGALKAGSFVRATIELASPKTAVLVPRSALQRAQGHDLVFVRTAAGQYDPVSVEVGGRTSEAVEVVSGLAAGAQVVTTGSFMLKTEILKDSIGAGCADGH